MADLDTCEYCGDNVAEIDNMCTFCAEEFKKLFEDSHWWSTNCCFCLGENNLVETETGQMVCLECLSKAGSLISSS